MTYETQKFWTETPLKTIEARIADLETEAQSEFAIENELADMYQDDANDFKKAIELFRQSDNEALANHIAYMDTSPREDLVMAFAADCGKDFVSQNLGWEIR